MMTVHVPGGELALPGRRAASGVNLLTLLLAGTHHAADGGAWPDGAAQYGPADGRRHPAKTAPHRSTRGKAFISLTVASVVWLSSISYHYTNTYLSHLPNITN